MNQHKGHEVVVEVTGTTSYPVVKIDKNYDMGLVFFEEENGVPDIEDTALICKTCGRRITIEEIDETLEYWEME